MSLASRIVALATALGQDIGLLQSNVPFKPCRVRTASYADVVSPPAAIDGEAMVAGDRVLYSPGAGSPYAGIYIWTAVGQQMLRAPDANKSRDFWPGRTVYVYGGVEYGYTEGSHWTVTGETTHRQAGPVLALDSDYILFNRQVANAAGVFVDMATQAELNEVKTSIAAPCMKAYTAQQSLSGVGLDASFSGDRVLLTAQTNKQENGVYTYDANNETLIPVAGEIYAPGRLFPVVTQSQIGLDIDWVSPEVWACTEIGGSEGYTFTKITGSGSEVVAARSQVKRVTGATSIDFDGLSGAKADQFIITVRGTYDANPAGGLYMGVQPNKATPAVLEAHIHQTYNASGGAGVAATHDVAVLSSLLPLARTFTTSREAVIGTMTLDAVQNSVGQRTFHGRFSSRRGAGNYQHIGGETHGWWEGGTTVDSLRITFGAAFTGTITVESVTGEGTGATSTPSIPAVGNKSLKAVLTANANPVSGGVVVFNSVERGIDWLDKVNGRIVPQVPGLYRVRCSLVPANNATAAGQSWEVDLRKNTQLIDVKWYYTHASGFRAPVAAEATVEMNGTTDFLDVLRLGNFGNITIQAVSSYTYLEVTYEGPIA